MNTSITDPIQARRALLEAELARYVELLREHYHLEQIILFGSLAEGTIHEWSDIDLAVVMTTEQPFWERLADAYRLLQPNVSIDLLIYTPKEWQEVQQRLFIQEEMLKKGRVLYESTARSS